MSEIAAKTCSVSGCEGPICNSRGWCHAHYLRWLRHGNPLSGRTRVGEPLRFLRETVLPYAGSDCLLWPFARDREGYGQVWYEGRVQYAHRIACQHLNGNPPTPGHYAAHSCGNGNIGCCCPKHLRWATPSENQSDRVLHGTDWRGEKNGCAKLTESMVLEIISLRGTASQKELAEQFGAGRQTISDIHRGRRWAFLTSPESDVGGR